MPGRRFAWVRLALLCGLLFLAGCSSNTFVYNRLDFLLPWYLDDYVDLNRDQAGYLDELLEPFLAWHRRQEMPRYAALIEELRVSLEEPITVEDLEAVAEGARAAWLRTEAAGLEWMLELGTALSDEQIDELMQSLWKQHEEYKKKYLKRDDPQYFEDSYESLRDNVTDYVGRISKQQRRALEVASERMRRSDGAWLEEQAQWLSQLDVLLQRQEGWQLRVREAVKARPQQVPEQYKALLEHNTRVIQEALVQLHASLTAKQQEHLSQKLGELRDELEALGAANRQ